MKQRPGFTLLEVMVAIVITGVVALLVYGTASTGIDTEARLQRFRTNVEAQIVLRALLLDALRHPVEGGGAAMNDELFSIDDAISADGLPVDGLRFLTRGVASLSGAAETWSIALSTTEAGVRLQAIPGSAREALPVDAVLAQARGLNVRALSRSADSVWSDRWDVTGRVPAAVSVEFLDASGLPVAPPLVVHAALESVR